MYALPSTLLSSLTILIHTISVVSGQNVQCLQVKGQANICHSYLQDELGQYQIADRSSLFMKKLANYCAGGSTWHERSTHCIDVKQELAKCKCDSECLEYMKLSQFDTDFIKACQKDCNQYTEVTKRLEYCIDDLPIIPVKEGKYTDFCRTWMASNKCTKGISIAFKCNLVFVITLGKAKGKDSLAVGEYDWIARIADDICYSECKDEVLPRAENCSVLFLEAISLDKQPVLYCKKLKEFFRCVNQKFSDECLTIEEVFHSVYKNYTDYKDFMANQCPDILSPPTTTSTTTTIASTTPVTIKDTTNEGIETTTVTRDLRDEPDTQQVISQSRFGNSPLKPCEKYATPNNNAITHTRLSWILNFSLLILCTVLLL